jgi:anthranilate synthase/aminodeoxychorismate synthase-like glutamine amidotransferase
LLDRPVVALAQGLLVGPAGLGELGAEPIVVRNDELTVDEALALRPDAVLVSPGPGRPEDAGIICAAIVAFAERGVPVFGVCLGHQAIGHVFGASVVRAPHLMHGKTSAVVHHGLGVFAGLPSPLTGAVRWTDTGRVRIRADVLERPVEYF